MATSGGAAKAPAALISLFKRKVVAADKLMTTLANKGEEIDGLNKALDEGKTEWQREADSLKEKTRLAEDKEQRTAKALAESQELRREAEKNLDGLRKEQAGWSDIIVRAEKMTNEATEVNKKLQEEVKALRGRGCKAEAKCEHTDNKSTK